MRTSGGGRCLRSRWCRCWPGQDGQAKWSVDPYSTKVGDHCPDAGDLLQHLDEIGVGAAESISSPARVRTFNARRLFELQLDVLLARFWRHRDRGLRAAKH